MTHDFVPGRRTALSRALALAAIGALPLARVSPAFGQALKLAVGVGLAQEQGALVLQMQKAGLLEQAAAELGQKLELEYLNFPVLLRMLQGIAAGQLQFGNLGSTPTIRMLAAPDPAVPIALIGGFNPFPLQVPKGSPIRNLDGLKGKTILTIVGSDLHLVLNLMLQAHFGTDDAKALGITVRNIQALTELGRAQPGIDAVVSLDPLAIAAEQAGELVTLARNDGTTGPAWDGPEGKGAGHRVASFAKTPFQPEAYYPHRIWWVVRSEFLKQHPGVVESLLVANHRACEALQKMSAEQLVDLAGANWTGTRAAQVKWIDTVLWRRRGYAWYTEGDVRTLVGLSKVKSIFQQELTAESVKRVIAPAAPVIRRAWERVGQQPPVAVLSDTAARDTRGRPAWEIDRWTL